MPDRRQNSPKGKPYQELRDEIEPAFYQFHGSLEWERRFATQPTSHLDLAVVLVGKSTQGVATCADARWRSVCIWGFAQKQQLCLSQSFHKHNNYLKSKIVDLRSEHELR